MEEEKTCTLYVLDRSDEGEAKEASRLEMTRQTMINFLGFSPVADQLFAPVQELEEERPLAEAVRDGTVTEMRFVREKGMRERLPDFSLAHAFRFAEKWVPPVKEGEPANPLAYKPAEKPLPDYDLNNVYPPWVCDFYKNAFYPPGEKTKSSAKKEESYTTHLIVNGGINTKFDSLPRVPNDKLRIPPDASEDSVIAKIETFAHLFEYFQIAILTDVVAAVAAACVPTASDVEMSYFPKVGELTPEQEQQIKLAQEWLAKAL